MIQLVKGTKDIYGAEVKAWQEIEGKMRRICETFGIGEIRTPAFEFTELFARGVGETTDIVQKEMYTFTDDGDRSLTLRPEGTAGVARAYVEHGMHNQAQPTKLYYISPTFRCENTQAGRQRQFHQFGIEMLGSYSAAQDAEVISVATALLEEMGVEGVELRINSLGCPECRARYNKTLKEFIGQNLDKLCPTCKERFEKNPLRVLDCKEESCQKIVANAPSVLDCLDEECTAHFQKVQDILTANGIPFTIDPKIVRGLDYYTRTVFEFVSNGLTVCGGGRYDNLVEEVGGKPTGAVGFGLGIERLIMILEKQHGALTETPERDVYIGSMGDAGLLKAQSLVYQLRKAGIKADCDTVERSVKAQMKYANKIGAKYSVILGDSELESGKVELKEMATSEKSEVALAELADILKEKCGK
ncbi:histidine--tRNA ligase [Anaerotignum sp.]